MSITILRHCQSRANVGEHNEVDSQLTPYGIDQAKDLKSLTTNYDLVICSPLRRTRQTLEFSEIKYKELLVTELCRERIIGVSDTMEGESLIVETDESFWRRFYTFKELIYNKRNNGLHVLVVSHAYFVSPLPGCYGIKNGQMIILP